MRIDKDNIKIILILLVVFLGIGYSYLNTDLAINGTANVNSANWSVYWNNVQVKSGSVDATTPTITDNTTINFNVTIAEPGDYYEFTVDAVNAGTLDAMIDTMDSKLNGVTIEELPAYLDYGVTYADDTPLDANQELLHDSTETYKVHIGYADYVEASDLPDTNQSLSLEFSITYKQADDNSQPVDHATIVYTVSSTGSYIEQAMPNDITQYSSAEEAMQAFENRSYCLKHIIRNNLILESDVVFVISQVFADSNPGMTAGTYVLRGAITYDENASNTNYCKPEYYDINSKICISPYYKTNKKVLQTAFGPDRCQEKTTSTVDMGKEKTYSCLAGEVNADASAGGWISAYGNSRACGINNLGESHCAVRYG